MDAAKGENIFGARLTPKHTRLLAAETNDGFASGFDDSRTDKEALAPKRTVLHAFDVVDEISQRFLPLLGHWLFRDTLGGLAR